ncbi:hypothetical protein M3650_14115 [Paenibacillus sp. MER TA 81-3]|uniref:hypothetical protein n=1 Tax=Paenibacillus sp. MER TA 81-3 TaxID=2939573 RepID=UPI002041B337|nr:hypothetical protein [Paenibacillus sp. MER TA 81-3]MCM3339732.1 hypothetical protein [Paenibacillus sp. MER TA 81-3]
MQPDYYSTQKQIEMEQAAIELEARTMWMRPKQSAAGTQLGEVHDKAMRVLVELLDSEHEEHRLRAAETIMRLSGTKRQRYRFGL